MQLTLHVPGSTANSSTHKNEYQAFLRRFSAKKTDSKFPDLAKRFKDKQGRGKLFQDWMDCEGNLTSLRIFMVRTAKHQTRARRKMEGKTEKDCRAQYIFRYMYILLRRLDHAFPSHYTPSSSSSSAPEEEEEEAELCSSSFSHCFPY